MNSVDRTQFEEFLKITDDPFIRQNADALQKLPDLDGDGSFVSEKDLETAQYRFALDAAALQALDLVKDDLLSNSARSFAPPSRLSDYFSFLRENSVTDPVLTELPCADGDCDSLTDEDIARTQYSLATNPEGLQVLDEIEDHFLANPLSVTAEKPNGGVGTLAFALLPMGAFILEAPQTVTRKLTSHDPTGFWQYVFSRGTSLESRTVYGMEGVARQEYQLRLGMPGISGAVKVGEAGVGLDARFGTRFRAVGVTTELNRQAGVVLGAYDRRQYMPSLREKFIRRVAINPVQGGVNSGVVEEVKLYGGSRMLTGTGRATVAQISPQHLKEAMSLVMKEGEEEGIAFLRDLYPHLDNGFVRKALSGLKQGPSGLITEIMAAYLFGRFIDENFPNLPGKNAIQLGGTVMVADVVRGGVAALEKGALGVSFLEAGLLVGINEGVGMGIDQAAEYFGFDPHFFGRDFFQIAASMLFLQAGKIFYRRAQSSVSKASAVEQIKGVEVERNQVRKPEIYPESRPSTPILLERYQSFRRSVEMGRKLTVERMRASRGRGSLLELAAKY